jgi:Secretion system C-terminal sorting domain
VDKTSFLGKIFEFDGHLLAGQAGIYKIFIGDSTLSNAYFNEVSWFTDQGDKIYLSKKAKQHQGVLYYEILIDKHDNSKISTGVYATEENGKLLLLKDNESKIYVDYNLSLDNEVQISEAKKLKLLNSEIVNNNLGLNLNKYNFLVKEIGNEENLSYINLICNKDNFFLDDLLTQYNLSGQVTCIYLNQDLLISNDNSCNQVLHTIEVDNTTKVYPNPATNIINVSTHKKGNYYIEIYSSTGYLMHTANFTDAIELPIAEFNQGFYFIKILDNKKELIHSEKFIKL